MMRAEQQSSQTDSSALSDPLTAVNSSSVSDPDAAALSPHNSPARKRIGPDPSSHGDEDLITESTGSDRHGAVRSPQNSTDDSSPTPKRMRLDPSSLTSEDLGDKRLTLSHVAETVASVCSSDDDGTTKSKGVKFGPASLRTKDSSAINSDLVKPVTSESCSSDESSRAAERLRLEPSSVETEDKVSSPRHKDRSSDCVSGDVDSKSMSTDGGGGDAVIMVCDVTVRKADLAVKLEMEWVDGQNRELMHQLLQFFKNRLV